MPPATRKRKSAPTVIQQPSDLINPSADSGARSGVTYKDDDPLLTAFENANDIIDSESEVSDYGKSKRKRRKTAPRRKCTKGKTTVVRGPGPAPTPPELSDQEMDEMNDDDFLVCHNNNSASASQSKPIRNTPHIITVQVGQATTINLDLAEILRNNIPTSSKPQAHAVQSSEKSDKDSQTENLFMLLPAELRNRVYRMLLVTLEPIVFHNRQNFKRSGQFLRVCKSIAEEGTTVMYGQNSFHFERTNERRGKFWEEAWKEIGFRDIHRFLETVGSLNVSKLKYLSFNLEDAANHLTAELDHGQRKFVNDPVLYRILTLIAEHASLTRLDVVFNGRAQVQLTDYHFLKALSSIRASNVKFPRSLRKFPTKVTNAVLDRLKPLMVVNDPAAEGIDSNKIKQKVMMMFDEPVKGKCTSFSW